MSSLKILLAIATAAFVAVASAPVSLTQPGPTNRITKAIDENSRFVMRGHHHRLAQPQLDHGKVGGLFTVDRITMVFKPTAAQLTNLDALLKRLQDPSSPDYHKWLTPEEFADRFGLSRADMDKVDSWLRDEGFTVVETARSRRWITFAGTAKQIESAFRTELHEYVVDGESRFANATEPSVPAALAEAVLGFRSLNDFPLKPRIRTGNPDFTSSVSGNHFLAPDDLATIFDLNSLYTAGIDGREQKIAIMGQTNILLNDLLSFRSISGLPISLPLIYLVPGSAPPGIRDGDIQEADLDLEWAGAVAPNAGLVYVMATNVFDSLQYAIDQNLAPVISISYGDCESNFTDAEVNALTMITQQANAQGITIVVPSGDAGAADCDGHTDDRQMAMLGLNVDLPAGLPYVTAVGGTTLYDTGNYWSNTNNDRNGSAISYIPEVVWNDTLVFQASHLAAGGGGKSARFTKPPWQVGRGVPRDGRRDVPDISFPASVHVGYLTCSLGSCVNGYRTSTGSLNVVGGTSTGAPVFAGILALLNQKMHSSQGNVNPALYLMAQIVPDTFHDITTGGNWVPCQARTTDCPRGGLLGYTAGLGYDLATGLGSLDGSRFVTTWALLFAPR
jgi:subtilase family serine protease